ncbi:DNA repair protein RecN [Limnochorda pilosa]|uniref:DNA repair protein RecN n=1 Tax=Limnochorda pilosa TaxID=1555112 RepID=A0A0K2SMS5_LIMPI|nr:DNA repair protein RecN [Limnochorda pilosa]BAS28416.1 DNA repair protein RecN [Limnochorda pilosa]
MLLELHLRNVALIERLDLAFGRGLSALTGETGAGKSILIDSITTLLGERAQADLIREGSEQALLEAAFDLSGRPEARALLAEEGLLEDDEVLVVRRDLSRRTANRCRLNGHLAPLATLQRVAPLLVELQTQNSHHFLASPARQLDLLDQFGGGELLAARRAYEDLYARWSEAVRRLEALRASERERAREAEMLAFQIQEIEGASLEAGEEEALEEERRRLAHAEQLRTAAQLAYSLLYEGGEQAAASDQLATAARELGQAAQTDPSLKESLGMVESAAAQATEAAHGLRAYLESLRADPQRLDELESRLHLVRTLSRKYGDGSAEILAYGARARRRLEELEREEGSSAALEEEIAALRRQVAGAGEALGELRRQAARRLEERITGELSQLAMDRCRFQVDLSLEEAADGVEAAGRRLHPFPHGFERVLFLIEPNPGEGLRPLSRIASGGELSRILLGLKSALAEADATPTLIFDEADAGIGGRTAQAVGHRLERLARAKQVLCVTHLPQIASLADAHYRVSKSVEGERTRVRVDRLEGEARVEELTRMLGGQAGEAARAHARQLLEEARQTRSASESPTP